MEKQHTNLAKIASHKTTFFTSEQPKDKTAYPLSSAQSRMYILNQLDRESTAYNMSIVEEMGAAVDIDMLEAAFNQLIKRHESLRTSFELREDGISQIVQENVDFNIDYRELPGSSLSEVRRNFVKPFDLSQAPLMRVGVAKVATNRYLMLLDMHHIISDAISMEIIREDFMQLLAGNPLPKLHVQYKDFALQQHEVKASDEYLHWEKYWLNKFQGELPVLNLGTDFPRASEQAFEGKVLTFSISAELTAKIKHLLKAKRITAYAFNLAIYNVLLYIYTGSEDIIIGCPSAGRTHPAWDKVVGMFVNTLATRNYPSGSKNFNQFLDEVARNSLDEIQYQGYQFNDLIQKLDIDRNGERNPLFDTMFNFHDAKGARSNPGVNYGHKERGVKFDLSLKVTECRNTFYIEVEYLSSLFREETINRLAGHITAIFESVVAQPDIEIGQIECLSQTEKTQILRDFNSTAQAYPTDKTLIQLFEEQVSKTPERIALIYKHEKITYDSLNKKANQLGRFLRNKGVKPETKVGVMIERSPEMLIGILGILKAGGAYVPIDPNYPEDRIDYILKDSEAEILLINNHEGSQLNFSGIQVLLDENTLSKESEDNLIPVNQPHDLLYVIYTSGSTGKPKGVMIEHHTFLNLIHWFTTEFEIDQEENILLVAPISFDLAQKNIYSSLVVGGTLTLMPEPTGDYELMAEVIHREAVSSLNCSPSAFYPLLDASSPQDYVKLKSLRKVFLGGEAIATEKIYTWTQSLNFQGTEIINTYGPTEFTDIVSSYRVKQEELANRSLIPIGKPIWNDQLLILDKNQRLLPIGVAGELHLTGIGQARGYLNKEELTQEKFVPCPHIPGGSMYKTGDLAKWLPNGEVLYLGRIDNQVKIRGFRIEPGEIESRLNKHERIEASVVVAWEKQGEKHLVAYYASAEEIPVAEIRMHILAELPDFMVPTYFVHLEALPLTPNGKINRKALPEPEIKKGEDYEPASNEIEVQLVEIWADVLTLKTEDISIKKSFFELGGHSLRATMMLNKIHKTFSVEIPLKRIFTHQSIKKLALEIRESQGQEYISIPVVEQKEHYALSSAQKRLYFLYDFDKNSLVYNMPRIIHLGGSIEATHIQKIISQLISRHESLRTSFKVVKQELVQVVADKVDFELEIYTSSENQIDAVISSFIRPFDLSQGPLIRAALVNRVGDSQNSDCLLLIDIHHIVSDGVSNALLEKEFVSLFNGEVLPELSHRYVDFSEWQQGPTQQAKIDKQKEFWLSVFESEMPVWDLPVDYARPKVKNFEGNTVGFSLPKDQTQALKLLANQSGTTLFTLMLSLFNVFLKKLGNQDDITVGTVTSGRDHSDLEGMVGMFVRTIPLRNYPKDTLSFASFLSNVHTSTWEYFENQDFPYEELVDELDIIRDTSRNPLFDILFAYDSFEEGEGEIEDLETRNVESSHTVAKFDLTLSVAESRDQLLMEFEYATSLFKEETIHRFIAYFQEMIAGVLNNPSTSLAEIEIIPAKERQLLLTSFQGDQEKFPTDKHLKELFENQVEINPEAIALIFNEEHLSYDELNKKANQVAHYLLQKGIKTGDVVAILIERSIEMLVAILGAMKTGATYLPLDTEQPNERIQEILKVSKTSLVLTKSTSNANPFEFPNCIYIDQEEILTGNTKNPELRLSSNQIAYIIFTSGSTGKPKGVEIYHHAINNLIFSQQKNYQMGSQERILQFSNISFDASVEQIYLGLLCGNTLVLVSKHTLLDPLKFHQYIRETKITHLDITPSYLQSIQAEFNPELKRIVIGGEACNPATVKQLAAKYQVHNVYGPTESTVSAIQYQVPESHVQENIPIGKPLHNIEAYILGRNLELLPIGVPGCLYLGGKGLAKGYLNAPKLTEKKFIANPFKLGENLYNTGDIASWLTDGNIAFWGRADEQIKLRGFRIEPGEIEQALLGYEGIQDSLILVHGEEDKYLVMYYASEYPFEKAILKGFLAGLLPAYMIPRYFIHVQKFPLSNSGKIDKRALSEIPFERENNFQKPQTEIEKKLASVWAEILKMNPASIGTDQSFFELGGHSLRATIMVNKVAQELEVALPIREVFSRQTIQSLASYIEEAEAFSFESIPKAIPKKQYKLSSAQKRLYFFYEFEKESLVYNMPVTIQMRGELDREKLQKTFEALISRHGSLRTSFHNTDQGVIQQVAEALAFEIAYFESPLEEIEDVIANFTRPFDLSCAPLLRAGIVQPKGRGDDEEIGYVLMVDMHHIISDGISHNILEKEFLQLYNNETLDELPIQYIDYAEWEQSDSQQAKISKQKSFWLDTFAEPAPSLNLPLDFTRPLHRNFEGAIQSFSIGKKETDKLRELCRTYDVSMFMLLLSVFNVLLARLSNEEDIIVGTVVAGRDHTDLDGVMGMFVRTLPLRNYPKDHLPFDRFLQGVKKTSLDYFDNSMYPYEALIDELHLGRDTSRNPLFDVMFILQNFESNQEVLPDAASQYIQAQHSISKFDLSLIAFEAKDQINFSIEYAKALFSPKSVARFTAYFQRIITEITRNPHIELGEIEMLPTLEKNRYLEKFNDTKENYPKEKTVLDLFEEQVVQHPNLIAVSYEGESVSFRQLANKANRLAAQILALTKAKPEVRVAVMMAPSVELIISMLAVLKAHATYIAISPDTSPLRREYIFSDSQAELLLIPSGSSEESKRAYIGNKGKLRILEVPKHEHISMLEHSPKQSLLPSSIMYIIYTSGTTGKPKGVLVPHKGIVNMLYFHQQLFSSQVGIKASQVANINFDASAFEIWPSLVHGGHLHIAPPAIRLNPQLMRTWLLKHTIEFSFQPTAIAEYLLNDSWPEETSLKVMNIAGDRLHTRIIEDLPFQVNNLYGPTEDSIWTTWKELGPSEENTPYSIGRPIANKEVFILSKTNRLQPIGVVGELCIAGEGLATSYCNDEALTQKKFIENPFQSGSRIYKTGDLARWLPNGEIEFIGRLDHQVKIRGFRIELGEIINCILQIPEIKDAVVLSQGEQSKYLVAYYAADLERDISTLKAHLRKSLPEYMIPTFFVFLEKLPLTANGKLDLKGLPKPERNLGKNLILASTQTELQLLDIWENILAIEKSKISADSSFFELGGHSLTASLMVNQIARDMAVQVPLKSVFLHQDIISLGKFIDEQEKNEWLTIPKAPKKSYYPLSSAQKRMFFLNTFNPQSTAYNMPSIIQLDTKVDKEKLKIAFDKLINRHASLRTSFHIEGKEVCQRIQEEFTFELQEGRSSKAQYQQFVDRFIQPFDLGISPLLRACILEEEDKDESFALLIDMPHIISDGISQEIIERDLKALYEGKELEPLRIQYVDYAEWEQSREQVQKLEVHQRFWLEEYTSIPPSLELPTDYSRKAIQDFLGAHWGFRLRKSETRALRKIAKDSDSTMFMVLLTIFNVLLSKLSGEEDITVGTVTSGRDHADLEALMGMFVRTLPLRNYPQKSLTFNELLLQVKERTLNSFEHQAYPYELLIDELNFPKNTSHNPLFDVFFTYQKQELAGLNTDENDTQNYAQGNELAKFDLSLHASENEEDIWLNIGYATSLFHQDTIVRFADYLQRIISEITSNPKMQLADVDMLPKEEKQQILYDFNQTAAAYPRNENLVNLFEQQVIQNPTQVALLHNDITVNYQDLNESANKLGHYLKEKGLASGEIVGIRMDRSIEMFIAMLGILKAGAAYLPIDIELPTARAIYMLEDSGCRFLIKNRESIKAYFPKVEEIDLNDPAIAVQSKQNVALSLSASQLCYVIYTSGSTGKPKGVLVPHKSVINLIFSQKQNFGIKREERILQFSSISFDASIEQIWLAFLSGASLVLIDKGIISDNHKFNEYLARHEVSHLHATPSFLESIYLSQPNGIKRIIAGGEACSRSLVNLYAKDYIFYNEYGPTETTVTSIENRVAYSEDPTQRVPIGKPIKNTRAYILDSEQKMLGIGVKGELFLAGAGLSLGYLNREGLTQEKFLDDPFYPGEKMYRTGDIARWLPTGDIEFHGRIDNQVKIRGYRIELGEIESHLSAIEEIKEAVVIARGNTHKYLTAYLISEKELDTQEINHLLQQQMPAYMLPAFYVQIAEFPLTANGKLDKDALPNPSIPKAKEHLLPSTQYEHKLLDIWANVLDLEAKSISITQNFFELGGHSLRVTIMANQIRESLGIDISIKDIFDTPNILKIAEKVAQKLAGSRKGNRSLVLLREEAHSQEQMFWVHDGSGDIQAYAALTAQLPPANYWGLSLEREKIGPELIDISKLSSTYIQEIKKVQKKGPYKLAGWSLGGIIAVEMARQLEAAGEEVSHIWMIDSVMNQHEDQHEDHTSVSKFSFPEELSLVGNWLPQQNVDSLQIKDVEDLWLTLLEFLGDKEMDLDEIKTIIPSYIKDLVPQTEDQNLKSYLKQINTIRSLQAAHQKYKFTAKVKAHLVYIKASETKWDYESLQDFFQQEMAFFEVQGDHFSIMRSQRLNEITRILSMPT